MKSIFRIYILCIFPFWANSQNNLSFKVMDRVTEKPVPFASIKILGTEKYMSTDKDGYAEISNINIDSINISSVGYSDTTISIISFKNKSIIKLSEKYQLLEDIIVGNFKEYDLGLKNLKTAFSYSANLPNQIFFAAKIDIPENLIKVRLEGVNIAIRKTKYKNINPVRLHLLGVDSNGFPSEQEYLKRDLVIPNGETYKNYLEFDLRNQNIILNRNLDSTIYVGIEFISVASNEIYDGPEIIITTESTEQKTVFKNLVRGFPYSGKWLFMTNEGLMFTKSIKKVHPHNMLATIKVSAIQEK
ncbi:MAG: carboxypeptidase-like regulatory domain-containing protein [Bacteroidetes bacterium]|nr:carboxypeptidase-like regulatory domain-containing protein [Bacteroidota bacterium]